MDRIDLNIIVTFFYNIGTFSLVTNDCPISIFIPIYLLGLCLLSILQTIQCTQSKSSNVRRHSLRYFFVLIFIWCIGGSSYIFSIYMPDFEPKGSSRRFCRRLVYLVAFFTSIAYLVIYTIMSICYLNRFIRHVKRQSDVDL